MQGKTEFREHSVLQKELNVVGGLWNCLIGGIKSEIYAGLLVGKSL